MSKTKFEECLCRECGGKFQGEVTACLIGGRERAIKPWECPACSERLEAQAGAEREEYLRAARDEERARWRSAIPAHLRRCTFESFEPGYQDAALKVCRRYAAGLDLDKPEEYPSLILYSAMPVWARPTSWWP